MANLYYREDLSADAFAIGATVEIAGDEARHALRVSRLRVGERIMVGNGAGALGEGAVVSAAKDRFAVRFDFAAYGKATGPRIVLVQALAKGDRDERAVEQATEFGVDGIVPWQAERSVSRWVGAGVDGGAEKAAKGVAKWRRIAREASKQSLRPMIPTVGSPVLLAELCELARGGASVLVLHPEGERALSDHARERFAGGLGERAQPTILRPAAVPARMSISSSARRAG
ncbi:RsmE family RNA methyltransferase [Leucobacter soli]|uniref:RsmE family RNA methyltransferase n=1 Tax=Leucobacter soli TaxID=2812850 RepID=UPI0036231E0B